MLSLHFQYTRPGKPSISIRAIYNNYHGYLSHNQRVSDGFPMVFLLKPPFSYGFPMVFLWFSYGFPMVFLWFSYGFLKPSLFSLHVNSPKNVRRSVPCSRSAARGTCSTPQPWPASYGPLKVPAGWWYTYTSEKYESVEVGMMKFPINIWQVIKFHASSHHQPASYKYALTKPHLWNV